MVSLLKIFPTMFSYDAQTTPNPNLDSKYSCSNPKKTLRVLQTVLRLPLIVPVSCCVNDSSLCIEPDI